LANLSKISVHSYIFRSEELIEALSLSKFCH